MNRQLSALAILLCAAGTASAAVTVTFNQDENGYTGTIDTGFYFSDAFGLRGADAEISIDEDDGGPTQGAIRFTNIFQNEGGPIPTANTTIGYAELYLWADDPANPDSAINFHRVLAASPWDEDSNWASLGGGLFPDETGAVAKPILYNDVEARSTPDFAIPDPTLDEVPFTFDVTAAVQSWVNGADNLGWAASQNTTAGWDFSSSEELLEEEQPRLTVVYYTTGQLADIDGMNGVTIADYQLLLNNMGLHVTQSIFPGESGDLNFDRKIDPADFGIFKAQFPGGVAALEAALAAVPEPSSAILVLLSACGLALRTRRTGRLSA